MQGKKAAKQDIMHLIASGIVQGRYGILLIFLAAAVCVLALVFPVIRLYREGRK